MFGVRFEDETIDLFSNAVHTTEHVNTPADFVNMLPEIVNLADLEVGVKVVSLATSWKHHKHEKRVAENMHWIVSYGNPETGQKNVGETIHAGHTKVTTGPYVQWLGYQMSLFFTLKPGLYDTGEEIAEQMVRQTNAAFIGSDHPPEFKLFSNKDHPDIDIIKDKRGLVEDKTNKWFMYANLRLCEELGFGQRDPEGVRLKQYVPIDVASPYEEYSGLLLRDTDAAFEDWFKEKGFDYTFGFDWLVTKEFTGERFRSLGNYQGSSNIELKDAIDLEHIPDYLGHVNVINMRQRFRIMCDFTEEQIVDNRKVPLLVSIPNPGTKEKTRNTYTVTIAKPTYVPCKSMLRKQLRVWVTDDDGHPLEFTWGSTHLLLHFRLKNPPTDFAEE